MKMNKMTEYAIRTIYAIDKENGDVVTSRKISEDELIPQGVLMKVLRVLKANNIVRSHQGRGEFSGGFTLAKSLEELTLLNIVKVMEGGIHLYDHEDQNRDKKVTNILKQTEEDIEHIMDNYVLSEIWEPKQIIARAASLD